MKYIQAKAIAEELDKLKNEMTLFSYQVFVQLINSLEYNEEVSIDIPDCKRCKYSLMRCDGTVKYCENDYRGVMLESTSNAPMAICGYYEEVEQQ